MEERYGCPHCGHGNAAGQRFCGSCGELLVLACTACGGTSPLDSRFCARCGADLRASTVAPPSGDERRVVTVLFADLVGFTSRAERLDPEDVRAILTPYYACLRDQIEAFGGLVEKFIGDAVMGLFGAPIAYGDDPERAVRAALMIRDAVGKLNDAHPDFDLQLRIAVNTGEAIVALGAKPGHGEAMVAGDVVNTAARLQTSAPVDSILVGEETYRCTRSIIEYEQVEPIEAKGKLAPIIAWRALAATRAPGERAEKGVPFVGRVHELAALTGIWQRVVADRRSHLVTILGAPGVGKTRLAAEFAAAVSTSGGQTIRGRSLPYGDSGAYGAFAGQVKQLAGIFASDPVAVSFDKLRQYVGTLVEGEDAEEVASHIAMLLGFGADEGVSDRRILFFSARRLVEALAGGRLTVLLFEDLHWADRGLLDLLELLSRIQDFPLLILTLARPDLLVERPSWGAGLPAYSALPLEPLSGEQSVELAGRLLAATSPQTASHVAAELAEAAEGNPLFIEELTASLAERAVPTTRELPTSIRGILASRLDALPSVERSLLVHASVVGKIFWSGVLARLGPYNERLPELLDSLERRDLIRREPASRIQGQQQFRFKHMLLRDVAYATLPRATRREAHAVAAAFLEEMTAASESRAVLAHHWREAGERDRAVDCFVAAADQASRGWAKEEAVSLYNAALALVPDDDATRRRSIRLRCAVAQTMVMHMQDVQRLGRSQPDGPTEE
jgi:class 3 adenylate cyclase